MELRWKINGNLTGSWAGKWPEYLSQKMDAGSGSHLNVEYCAFFVNHFRPLPEASVAPCSIARSVEATNCCCFMSALWLIYCWFAVRFHCSNSWNYILLHFCCFLSFQNTVQRNQFCLRGADQPWKEGTLRPLWRTRLAGRRWGRPRDGRYLLPHLWRWTLWIHGWPGESLEEWRSQERRRHGPSAQVRPGLHTRLQAVLS